MVASADDGSCTEAGLVPEWLAGMQGLDPMDAEVTLAGFRSEAEFCCCSRRLASWRARGWPVTTRVGLPSLPRQTRETGRTVKRLIPTTRRRVVLLVASQLSGILVAALEAAFPRIVVVSGPVVVSAAVIPTSLAARPDGLHVAAALPGVAVAAAEASTRPVII